MAACVPGGEFFLILMSLWNIKHCGSPRLTAMTRRYSESLESLFGRTLDVL